MKTLFADLRQHGGDAGRTRLPVVETVTDPWCTTTITACAINADAAAPAADRPMAKRTTFARKYHAQRPEEIPNG